VCVKRARPQEERERGNKKMNIVSRINVEEQVEKTEKERKKEKE
jgi:hypothetical protein